MPQHSHALANNTTYKGLEEKLESIKKDFMHKTTDVFKDCTELEAKVTKENRIKTFLFHVHKITDAFIFYEKVNTPLVTTLNEFSIWTVLIFLRNIKLIIPQPGDPFIYTDYLKMEYQEVKVILLENFIEKNLIESGEIKMKQRTDSEKVFLEKIVSKVQQTILPVTINLQTFLDKEEDHKKSESQITAKFKKMATRTATEATAIAIGDTSNTTNMEQHIKKIVSEAFKAHAASNNNNNNSKKQKNLQGDQAPHPSSLTKEKGKNTPQPKKKQKVAQQTTTNNNNGTKSILKTPKKKVRFQSNTKKGKDLPEGKKKGQRKESKKRKHG
jgi:hypothetical protein